MSQLRVSNLQATTFVPITATGGTVSNVTIGSNTFRVHEFTTIGSDTFTVTDPGSRGEIEYLVVGGGGGGGGTGPGNSGSGGGGAGGYRTGFITVSAASYPVVVGAGGAGGIGQATSTAGSNGNSSSFGSIVAQGGGGGAAIGSGNPGPGSTGASGGGGFNGGTGGVALYEQGNRGGNGINATPNWPGGGGGGAGSVGTNSTPVAGGNGGLGVTSRITGTAVSRAGGGGGGSYAGGAFGVGTGGGANGTNNNTTPAAATVNTGGGGGGVGGLASGGSFRNGGAGGSGVVIVSYPLTNNTIVVRSPSYIASPGSPIQVNVMRTDDRSTWAAPGGSTAQSYTNGTPVWPLSVSIRPKMASSLLRVSWMINGEIHYNTKWTIWMNDSLCRVPGYEGWNAEFTPAYWVGYVPGIYEAAVDVNSTLNHYKIEFFIKTNSTDMVTFTPAISGASTTAYTFFLNRTGGALGQDSYENAVSTAAIWEIAQ